MLQWSYAWTERGLAIRNPLPSTGTIRRRKRLGGMLNYYYREAA
jgi:hypothetical protein